MYRLLRLGLLGFTLTALHGQVRHPPTAWKKEPIAFMGVTFGVPIRSSIPACKEDFPAHQPLCFMAYVDGSYDLMEFAEPITSISVDEVDGNVQSVLASFRAEAASEVAKTLIEKFGSPQSTTRDTGGHSVMLWRGKSLTLEFNAVGTRFDEGLLFAHTTAWDAWRKATSQAERDKLKKSY